MNALDSPERSATAPLNEETPLRFQWSVCVWYESVFMFVIGSIPDTHAARPCPLRSISALAPVVARPVDLPLPGPYARYGYGVTIPSRCVEDIFISKTRLSVTRAVPAACDE